LFLSLEDDNVDIVSNLLLLLSLLFGLGCTMTIFEMEEPKPEIFVRQWHKSINRRTCNMIERRYR